MSLSSVMYPYLSKPLHESQKLLQLKSYQSLSQLYFRKNNFLSIYSFIKENVAMNTIPNIKLMFRLFF